MNENKRKQISKDNNSKYIVIIIVVVVFIIKFVFNGHFKWPQ